MNAAAKLGFGGQGPLQVRYERWVQGTAAIGPLEQAGPAPNALRTWYIPLHPLGPSTGRLSGKLGVVEVSILCPEGALALPSREGGSRSETGELNTRLFMSR